MHTPTPNHTFQPTATPQGTCLFGWARLWRGRGLTSALDGKMSKAIAVAENAISFLEAVVGSKQARAREAAAILKKSLTAARSSKAAMRDLQYGLSYKGVLEWHWSPEVMAKLEALSREFNIALGQ